MIRVIKGADLSTYRNQLQLNMIYALKYKADQVKDMSSEQMLNELVKHNKAMLIEKESKVLDPFNKQKSLNKEVNKISSPSSHAKMRNIEAGNVLKDPSYQKANKPDPLKEGNSNVTKRVRNNRTKHTMVNKETVKVKSAMSPRILNTKGLINKFRGSSGWAKLAIGLGVTLGMSWFINSFNKIRPRFNPTNISNNRPDYRGSSYIPEKYSRGYDTIKESLTDFGSKVKLNKVSSKVNVTPYNTTRNAFKTSVNSIINSNLALNAHNNAINHTRY